MSKLGFRRSGTKNLAPVQVPLDPEARRARFGPIQPMEQPSLLRRLFSRH